MTLRRIIGLDVGGGFTKLYDGKTGIIFLSVYAYRQPPHWDDGDRALEIVQHQAFMKLARYAMIGLSFAVLNISCAVSGVQLPCDAGIGGGDRVRSSMKDNLGLDWGFGE